jgi:hypothetical protein
MDELEKFLRENAHVDDECILNRVLISLVVDNAVLFSSFLEGL